MGQNRVKWKLLLLVCTFFAARSAAYLHTQYRPVVETVQSADTTEKDGGRLQTGDEAAYVPLPKQIALTFDDGPNPFYTELLLNGLNEREVKATFFLLGSEVELYPELVEKMDQEGHMIGVHSYEHVNFGQIGDEAAMQQIDTTREAIYGITGSYPGFIRPPYGCWKNSLNDKVPMIEVLWDVDPLDWATDDADAVVQRILKAVDKGGSIILLHDSSKSSVQAAFTIIDVLKNQGYEFVTVEELLLID